LEVRNVRNPKAEKAAKAAAVAVPEAANASEPVDLNVDYLHIISRVISSV
jgi:hypothetical protein